jgi:hypothetical protein
MGESPKGGCMTIKIQHYYWVKTDTAPDHWQPARYTGRDFSGIDTWDLIGVDSAEGNRVAVTDVSREIVFDADHSLVNFWS